MGIAVGEAVGIADMTCRYMIHGCLEREWYIEDYLIPSMTAQGIPEDHIVVCIDFDRSGNLEACMQSFRLIRDARYPEDGIWHIQDDVIISSDFARMTEICDNGIVCGYANHDFDKGNLNRTGLVPLQEMWFSFPCIRIPNEYAIGCEEWYRNEVLYNGDHNDLVESGKNDDVMFRNYMMEHHSGVQAYNLKPNLVDHIDYLIGGSVINQARKGIHRAFYWREPELVDRLEEDLEKRGSKNSRKTKKRSYL